MHPVLVRVGPLAIYSYGLALVLAFLVGTWLAARAAGAGPAARGALSPSQVVDLTCYSLLGGVVGARLFYVLLYWDIFLQAPFEMIALWRGGLVWYGGMVGAIFTGWCYVRLQRLVPSRVGDHMAPFMALGHAIGRIGCFLNGCCYGKPTEDWCGLVFPGQSQAVMPTQLFEAAGLIAIFFVLRRMQRSSALERPWEISGAYLIAYAMLRFALEFLRGDQTTWWGGLTLQQLISVGVLAVGMVLVGVARRRQWLEHTNSS